MSKTVMIRKAVGAGSFTVFNGRIGNMSDIKSKKPRDT